MAKSLSSIKAQIEKLQKQADSIQSSIITRIKKEIAQHGLTTEDLFGNGIRSVGNGASAQPKKTAKAKSGAGKPAKFADAEGNTWHGIGKRPGWIHDALEAGRKLEEFLIGKKAKPAAAPKAEAKVAKTKKPTSKKAPVAKKAMTAKKAPAKKAAPTPASKKGSTTAGVAKPTGKAAPKKALAKRAAKPRATVAAPAAEAAA